jgi:hypothetical protein
MEDGVGAIVDGVERGNHTATPDPDKAGIEEVSRSSLGCWRLELHLGKEKAGASKDFRNCVNWNFISFQKLIWQNNWSTKNSG